MTLAAFLEQLDRHLTGLPDEERRRAADFYSELILDQMENGQTEEEAVSELGPVEEVARKVMEEYTPIRQKSLFLQILKVIALILGVPLLLCLLIPLAAVALVLYVCLWILMASLFIVVLSLGLIGAVGIVGTVFILPQSLPAGVFQLGAGLVFCGLCLLSLIGAWKLLRLLLQFTVWLAKTLANGCRRQKRMA